MQAEDAEEADRAKRALATILSNGRDKFNSVVTSPGFVNATSGIESALSFGISDHVQDALGYGSNIDRSSGAYKGGEAAAIFAGVLDGEAELNAAKGAGEVIGAAVHGNSAASRTTSYLYRLSDTESGSLLKWGISKSPFSRYSQSFMQGKTMDLMTSGSRREMLDLERFIVERDPGPLNREPWAGAQSNDVPGGQ